MNAQLNSPLIRQGRAERLLSIIRLQTEIAKLGLDLFSVMATAASGVQNLTNADAAAVETAEGDEMVYRACSGAAGSLLGLRLKIQGSLSGLCVTKGVALRCDDSETDSRVDIAACRKVGVGSMIVTPLLHGKEVIGVLKVWCRKPNSFDDSDMEIVGLVSELIAASMFHCASLSQNELFHRATHDPLTGLANRALFYDRLRQELIQARRRIETVAVTIVDMDGLKRINDQCGHHFGDLAITEMSRRLAGAARRSDTVARLGGDEFAIVMPNVNGRVAANECVQRLRDTVSVPFSVDGNSLSLSASAGTAVFPDDGEQAERLIEIADLAMYADKKHRTLTRTH